MRKGMSKKVFSLLLLSILMLSFFTIVVSAKEVEDQLIKLYYSS